MDEETLSYLLRGGHIDMPERIRRGLWPHPPLEMHDVERYLIKIIENTKWFPGTIEEMGLNMPDIEGQITIENKGKYKYICHFADHYRHVQRRFWSSKGAAKFYMRWALHLPGDLDGWEVK